MELIRFKINGDEKGSLISLESNKNIPFDIKRVYYIFGTINGTRRGYHAHKNLRQVLICVSGSCKILLDNGKKTEILLNSSDQGLLVESLIWREMFDFSADCVLMVLADNYYDEEDYIRDYQEFLDYITKIKN